MKSIKLLIALLLGAIFIGCGSTRVVFVDTSADLVRIGPNFPAGKVYFFKDGQWVLSKNKVELPEGWYAGGIPKGDE